MLDADTIATEQMIQHLADGRAEALLPDGVPGPVRFTGQWWAVPIGQTRYRPVIDSAAVATLDRESDRLAAHRRHRAGTVEMTGERRQ